MHNTKCTSYTVDPRLLNAGIPIEDLEKRNIQIIDVDESLEGLNRYLQGTKRLCGEKSKEYYPVWANKPEIELGLSDYSKVQVGELIKIPHELTKHNGKRFKLKYKGTDKYLMRTLVVVGDKGYWR